MGVVRLTWVVLLVASSSAGASAAFTSPPQATTEAGKVKITFAVSSATDVEVAVLDGKGAVVRHLAAGAVGTATPAPPLGAGLKQTLAWDGKDDSGKPVAGGVSACTVRVRLGMAAKLGRMIGQNPLAMGSISGIATDAEGNVYVYTISSGTGRFKQLVALDAGGNYRRTLMPFPADLPAQRIKHWARHDGAPRPINRNGLGPEFYTNAGLTLLESADAKGLLLTDGRSLYRIAFDGGDVEGRFLHGTLWGKKPLPNSGGGPMHLAVSPDGKWLYLCGPYSSKTAYGHKFDPDFPPGQVYRMEIGKGTMKPFVKLPVIGRNPAKAGWGWMSKHISHPMHYTIPHGPVHAVAVTPGGHVLVADQDVRRVAVFDDSGEPAGEIPAPFADLLAVHPRTGAVYVLTKEIKGYGKFRKRLLKFAGRKAEKPVAELDLGGDGANRPRMALAAGADKTVLWISGLTGGVLKVEDTGDALVPAGKLADKVGGVALGNVDKLAVDARTDTVYVSDAWSSYRRFDGLTGKGGEVVTFEKGVSATDLVVGPKGYIYAQLGKGYSGPLGRYTRQLKPAPYDATGTHVLSKYIYGRYHGQGGNCEKGMGVGPDGTLYIYWMFGGWVRYAVSAWGPDGRPVNGDGSPIDEGHHKRGTPKALTAALIGPVPGAGGGVRVDSRGRIYIGVGSHPPTYTPPAGFAKDAAYHRLTGSVIRFGPEGGAWGHPKGHPTLKSWQPPKPTPAGALVMKGGHYYVGADLAFHGLGPMSGHHTDAGSFGNISFCVCRVPRFDLDRYDRLYLPNAVTNSVIVFDAAGNRLAEFGSYGNFDSQGAEGKGAVRAPRIPLGWPTGVGVSRRHIYVGDMYNRRIVRVDPVWANEKTCKIK